MVTTPLSCGDGANGSLDTRAHQADLGAQSPPPDAVREALSRVLASKAFETGERRTALLRFLVEETLAGHGDRLKGYSIGVAVFGRDDAFDPQSDPIVRLEAHRLRRDLHTYYATAGRHDPVRITVPKGRYVPLFQWQESPSSAPSEESPTPAERDVGGSAPPWRRHPARRWYGLVAVLAVCAVAAVVWFEAWHDEDPAEGSVNPPPSNVRDPALSPARGPWVAVLPFHYLGGVDDKKYFSDGMTYEIASDLSKFRNISVFSTQSTSRYARPSSNPGDIRRELGADYVIDGTFQFENDKISLLVQLIDTKSETIVWSEKYQGTLDVGQLIDFQAEIAQRVAAIIGGAYGVAIRAPQSQRLSGTATNLSSYHCVLQFYAYQRSFNREEHQRVRACLEHAVQRDPEYSQAWAALSTVYAQEYRLNSNPRPDENSAFDRALDAAKRAVALDPTNPTAQMMLANVRFDQHRLDDFKGAGERALILNPNDPDVLVNYGMRLAYMGEWDRGLALIRKAMSFNPNLPGWYRFPFAVFRYKQGDYLGALEEDRKIDMPHHRGSHMIQAASFGQLNRLEDAQAAAKALLRRDPLYAAQFWERMRIWNVPGSLAEALADGLRKAGLDIPPPPPSS